LSINVLSVALLACALQGTVLAVCLWAAPRHREANRVLAALLAALVIYMTPYIIGYAGAYDHWPWLSFAPFNVTLSFGPLFFWHVLALTGGTLGPGKALHFAPFGLQFLSQLLVFPLPLAAKNAWHDTVHAPLIVPVLLAATLVSLTIYGALAWRRYEAYRAWLRDNRADGPSVEPSWIRNTLLSTLTAAILWLGFTLANALDPGRDYFDAFWLYLAIGLLTVYLGVEGWRRSGHAFPAMAPEEISPAGAAAPAGEPDWHARGAAWAAEIDRLELWRDPEVSLASMAKAIGVNTTYLSRALNDGLGLTFHAFVNGRRVNTLKALLADPSETRDLTTLAFEAGFNSKASFNRAFAQHAGMTPSAFRRTARLRS
jgi:AraC-like DNA-binding protein